MLVQHYELFKMQEHETIFEMHERFTKMINALRSLDKTYSKKINVHESLSKLAMKLDAEGYCHSRDKRYELTII